MSRVHAIVKGRVQGVGFRYFVYDTAKRMNMRGYVRNLYSGEVEVEAECEDDNVLKEFLQILRCGSSLARVTDIDETWFDEMKRYKEFGITL